MRSKPMILVKILNGATTINSNFAIFACPEWRDAWQRGHDENKQPEDSP